MKRFSVVLVAVLLAALLAGCSLLSGVVKGVFRQAGLAVVRVTAAAAIEATASVEPEATPSMHTDTVEPTVEPTAEPTVEPTAEPAVEPTAEPTVEPTAEPTANPLQYTSTRLGIRFTLPDSWAGKYRVVEGDGYLSVYFKPAEDISDGLGNFFSIVKRTSQEDEGFLDNVKEYEANGSTYLFGTPTDVPYMQENPEYDTFEKMLKDLPDIFTSLRSAK